MIKQIPNAVTLTNLLMGCWGLVAILNMEIEWMFTFFLIGLACDFADGLLARLLNAASSLGKQLDSLADLITFGVLPSAMIYQIFETSHLNNGNFPGIGIIAFLVAVFTGLRLGRFNLDASQEKEFSGLPSPANAILICGIFLLYHYDFGGSASWIGNSLFLGGLVLACSVLMVIPVPFFSFKLDGLGWKGNELRFVFLAVSLVLVGVLHKFSLAFIILFYIFISLISALRVAQKHS